MIRPLDGVPGIKLKLGLLVTASASLGVVAVSAGYRASFGLQVTLGLGLVAVLAVTGFLARGMTSPLREMAAAAGRMAHGDHSVRVTATSRDEVGDLARAFNSMAAELAVVDEQRRRLVADVSHELRTPLTALQALLENLADGVTPADPQQLETAVGQVRRLGRLVAQLLDLSRLESGEVPLHRERIPLAPFLARCVREAPQPLQAHVHVEPAGLAVDADPERLSQVLANLLGNAARHTPLGSTVQIRATRRAAGVRLEVEDAGPGIAPGDRDRVFERFARTDAARTASDGGSGLGLSIARWVVDLHGGTVHVAEPAPSPPGRPPGCRLVVDLPGAAA